MLHTLRRIICITKSGDSEPHKRLESIGYAHTDGAMVVITHDEAVQSIRNGQRIFDVEIDGKSVMVTLGTGPNGERYLKGIDDTNHPETLLKLPPC
jgi:Protein of unknown function (DUF3892)